jgi:predicted TIM-barrel fold metal-dependent hydrolase
MGDPAPTPAATAPLRSEGHGRGVIDLHAHILTDTYRKACVAAGQGQPDGMPGLPEWSADGSLALMDSAGIDAAVLSISSPGVFFGDVDAAVELASTVNDEAARVVADHPTRFGFAASLPIPDGAAAVREAHRALGELEADAISLHTNYGGLYLGDPALDGLLGVLDSYGAVVLVHPTSPVCWPELSMGRPQPMVEFLLDTTRAIANLALNGCLSRYPNIRWVIPHTGAALPVIADRVHRFALAWAATEADQVDVLGGLQRLYFDVAGIPLPRALPALLGLVEPSQIVYGSDYPFTPPDLVRQLAHELVESGPSALDPLPVTLRRNAEVLFPRFGVQASAGREKPAT